MITCVERSHAQESSSLCEGKVCGGGLWTMGGHTQRRMMTCFLIRSTDGLNLDEKIVNQRVIGFGSDNEEISIGEDAARGIFSNRRMVGAARCVGTSLL